MLQKNSLAARQLLSSAILLPILMGVIAFALDEAFRNSQLSAEESSLRTQIYLLIGAAEPGDTELFLPEDLSEPRYSLLDSGLYAAVLKAPKELVWKSKSLMLQPDLPLKLSNNNFKTDQEIFTQVNIDGESLFYFSYDTVWNIDGKDVEFRFMSLHSAAEFKLETAAYRKTLWQWLGALALALIATQVLVIRWGLNPLKALAAELLRFQKGETHQLEGKYPAEISPVTENLNKLLESEKKQRERYRNTLSDLAHSLKTPLAVVRAEINKKNKESISATNIDEQVKRMADIINHQLQRATLRSTHALKNTVEIQQVVNRIANALQKVYSDKNIQFENTITNNLRFVGEESDAMELFGNLIENAFKYGNKKVKVSALSSQGQVNVSIEDDGPGVPPHLKSEILQRGARADTSIQGQGIGLAVAVDIISSYGGGLVVEDSELGGACFFLVSLPAAEN